MSSEQENEKSNDPKQTRLEYFLFPKTIAGDVGRLFLGSIIIIGCFLIFGLILVIFAMLFVDAQPGIGLGIMLIMVAGGVFVALPGVALLAVYFLGRRLMIIFRRDK